MNEKLIDSLWDYNNPVESENRFRKSLENAISMGDFDLSDEIKTQIARALGLQRRFNEAHGLLDEVKPNFDNNVLSPLSKVRYLLERGRVYRSSGELNKCGDYFLLAYNIANEFNLDFYTIDAAHMLGIIGNHSEQIEWNEKAIFHAENSTDKRSRNWLGALLNNTAWTYFGMNEFEKAYNLFIKSQKFYVEINAIKEALIANWSLGRTLRGMNKLSESLEYQYNNEKAWNDAGFGEDGYIHEEIAECCFALGRFEESAARFTKAHNILSKDIWLQANEPDRLNRMKELSNQ